MTARLVELMGVVGLAFIGALFVVPTAIAAEFGLHWWCGGGSLVLGAVLFAMLMREWWAISRSDTNGD